MLKSFYKYLVDELITDYFTTHKPGSFGLKYFYVLFENAEHRNGLYNAIAENLTAHDIQSPNQKIPDRKTKCVIKTHINIKQNVIFGAKLKPV